MIICKISYFASVSCLFKFSCEIQYHFISWHMEYFPTQSGPSLLSAKQMPRAKLRQILTNPKSLATSPRAIDRFWAIGCAEDIEDWIPYWSSINRHFLFHLKIKFVKKNCSTVGKPSVTGTFCNVLSWIGTQVQSSPDRFRVVRSHSVPLSYQGRPLSEWVRPRVTGLWDSHIPIWKCFAWTIYISLQFYGFPHLEPLLIVVSHMNVRLWSLVAESKFKGIYLLVYLLVTWI